MKYVFEKNELDDKCDELDIRCDKFDVQNMDIERKTTDIGFKVTAMQGVIKELDANSHPEQPFEDRIAKLEAFEKSIRNKKAFKSLGK